MNRSRGGHAWSLTARYIREEGTALHWAAYYGQQDIAKLLIDNGASKSLQKYLGRSSLLHLVVLPILSHKCLPVDQT